MDLVRGAVRGSFQQGKDIRDRVADFGFRLRKENVLVLNSCQVLAVRDLGIVLREPTISQVIKLPQTAMCCVSWRPILPFLGFGFIRVGGSGRLVPCLLAVLAP